MYLVKLTCIRTQDVVPRLKRCISLKKLGYWKSYSSARMFSTNDTSVEVTHRQHMTRLNATASYTLQSRILEYMRSNKKYHSARLSACSTNVPCLDEATLHNRMEEPLCQTILNANLHIAHLPSQDFLTWVNKVDRLCCDDVDKMSRSDILMTLDAWMYLVPHRLTKLNFYLLFVNKIKLWLTDNRSKLSLEEFLQILFFIGLLKKSPQSTEIVKLCLNYIDNFFHIQKISVIELCLLANSIFKTSTKIVSPKMLSSISCSVESHLDQLLQDPALLVTLIKPLKHAQFYKVSLLKTVENKIIDNVYVLQSLNFVSKVHLLAFYAGALYSNMEIIDILVKSLLMDLHMVPLNSPLTKKEYLNDRPRNKDLSRLLWSVSSLNYEIDKSAVKDCIIPHLMNRLRNNEFASEPEEIVDCLLSLWILGYKPFELVASALSTHNLTSLREKNKRRFTSRLALLLTCIYIEAPHILSDSQKSVRNTLASYTEPSIKRHLEKRPLLKKVLIAVSTLAPNYGFSKVSCNFVIPHLHIAGLVVNTPSHPLYIEVLDESVCLDQSDKLQGLMQLKLRLLSTLFNSHYIVVNGSEIEKKVKIEDLHLYINEEIRKVSRIFWK